MRYVFDTTGRFRQRPHFEASELDDTCEDTVASFLQQRYGEVRYPILTNDLVILLERRVNTLDLYADLSSEGVDVEGVTYFRRGGKPDVAIASILAEERWRENRFRTTLSHELAHVILHGHLWGVEAESLPLFPGASAAPALARCFRGRILTARQTDWMEWQAGFGCGALLMPGRELRLVLAPHLDAGTPTVGDVQAESMIALVQRAFAVSADAARVRLVQRGYLARQATLATY